MQSYTRDLMGLQSTTIYIRDDPENTRFKVQNFYVPRYLAWRYCMRKYRISYRHFKDEDRTAYLKSVAIFYDPLASGALCAGWLSSDGLINLIDFLYFISHSDVHMHLCNFVRTQPKYSIKTCGNQKIPMLRKEALYF